jgi:hypothetical protein
MIIARTVIAAKINNNTPITFVLFILRLLVKRPENASILFVSRGNPRPGSSLN